ncbi:uncharacterized protein PHACADRAFT_253499 [Phanerochaete carnosa HHB-10118-sp]|uniref:Uncharacterized protein n=1 Tax=Phanerochaete carnosa (strain HHB-10118-sp) TaxID=650164 RepID=K5X0Y9_PHACS|nr:uncharacterized protein PHACADRAFT_253499 [Phanerochaete carnosa HHB-10118-sp]EKM56407.1 hypothetical protein PHACADRAFT_253499 [Phanerochaete carnosa HHB-10118-sp]
MVLLVSAYSRAATLTTCLPAERLRESFLDQPPTALPANRPQLDVDDAKHRRAYKCRACNRNSRVYPLSIINLFVHKCSA